MGFFRRERIQGKTLEQLRAMRAAGIVVGQTLALLRDEVRPGMTTKELDTLAEEAIRSAGATPSFLGYHGFTGTTCTRSADCRARTLDHGRMLSSKRRPHRGPASHALLEE